MESELRWKKQKPTSAHTLWKQVSSAWGKKIQSLRPPSPESYSMWRYISLCVTVAGLLVLKCTLQNSGHPIVSENSVLCTLLLMSMPALLHWALLFFILSSMFAWTLVVPLLSLPNPKPRKAPGAPLSESRQIGSVCCVLRKVTSFRLMKQWQFQSA